MALTKKLVGKTVPEFTLKDSAGRKVKISDFRGAKVILYFYPKDDTPGCTVEACDFEAASTKFERKGVVVLGVSPDSIESHKKFGKKFGLSFPLLSDPKRQLAKKFGVYKQKNMYGRKVMGIERSTFVIDEKGKVVREMRGVKAQGHVKELLRGLK